jgi:hypothetical protein
MLELIRVCSSINSSIVGPLVLRPRGQNNPGTVGPWDYATAHQIELERRRILAIRSTLRTLVSKAVGRSRGQRPLKQAKTLITGRRRFCKSWHERLDRPGHSAPWLFGPLVPGCVGRGAFGP